jgi:hypothetical protein
MENGEQTQEDDYLLDIKVTPDEAAKLEAAGFTMSSQKSEEEKELEKAGFRKAPPTPPSQISQDLRKEILRILVTGDPKRENAFTVAVAVQLERLIHASKAILMAEKIASNDMGHLIQKNQLNGGGMYGSVGYSPFPQILGSDDETEASDLGLQYVGKKVKNENFGVQVIKELLSAARTFHDSPAKDVEALAVARREGLTDVVESLEAKLGISKPVNTPMTMITDAEKKLRDERFKNGEAINTTSEGVLK